MTPRRLPSASTWWAAVAVTFLLAGCEQRTAPLPPLAASAAPDKASHELGRQVYNFRCYYCHGYSGDAQTLAATFLHPPPRNFKAGTPAELPREKVIEAIANGRAGTAMKGFSGTLAVAEVSAVADFILNEFVRAKAPNTRYHTEANGWRDHQKFAVAFPFATGEIALDSATDSLSPSQQQGKRLFMSTCISCHDRARVKSEGAAWAIRPVTIPPDYYLLAESGRADEHSGFDPHHAHEKQPVFRDLTSMERRGEALYQKNCAFCHAADGTGRNWIGSFIEPNATDLSTSLASGKNKAMLKALIADGIDGTSMPAWRNVFTQSEIDAVAAYVTRAFAAKPKDRPAQS